MKRFRFALQKVHKLRRFQERAARLVMGQELSTLGRLLTKRGQVEANLRACCDESAAGRADLLAQALERGLTGMLCRVETSIEEAEGRVEVARRAYQDRRRDLLTMDKLHDTRRDAWTQEVAAEEQMEFDEMARLRYVVARRGER